MDDTLSAKTHAPRKLQHTDAETDTAGELSVL